MKIERMDLPEVLLLEPPVFRDSRGFFLETYNRQRYIDAGLDVVFVQDNHSSSRGPILRGLHAQFRRPQGKLVRAVEGSIFDVAVDIRRGSPRFGRWAAATLSADNHRQLFIPAGFAHGFCVLGDLAQVEYKCTDYYDPGGELTIRWDDPTIGIDWPCTDPILSDKDRAGTLLADLEDDLPIYPGVAP